MRRRTCWMTAAMLWLSTGTALAGHIESEEVNVVIMTCRVRHPGGPPDRDNPASLNNPAVLEVESVSVNATRNHVPHAAVGGSCAQYVHEFLTEGFEIANRETSGFIFVLTRRDKPYSGSGH